MARRIPETEAAPPPADADAEDHRERFVLRGRTEGVPNAVPAAPAPAVNVEAVLRRLESPERRRAHRRPMF